MQQLWGSRFNKAQNKMVHSFNSSLSIDCKLYKYDIEGSIAHAKMLGVQGIITDDKAQSIVDALKAIKNEFEEGKIQFNFEFEDIHTNIEKLLIEKIGENGKKLHTARSRNDQVALDIRLYLKDEIKNIQKQIITLISTLLHLQKEHTETIMPGYTHLQRAQAVTFAHHLGAYVEMFKRDFDRLNDCNKRVSILPLGSCALAGTPHKINREKTAQLLDFAQVGLNSMDCVSDRDFIIETLSALSLVIMHLSRFSEEIILWASFEFKFIELDDEFSTGSSIMPQKKNPDILELIRGKTGKVYGALVSILTTMKSLPLAYNKDMQEDKEPLFIGVSTVKGCLEILPQLLLSMKINKENMLKAVYGGFLNATDVADYLVEKGLAFREAHQICGNLVKHCEQNGLTLNELPIERYKQEFEGFEDDIYTKITPTTSIYSKNSLGGCAPQAVKSIITINEKWIKDNEIN